MRTLLMALTFGISAATVPVYAEPQRMTGSLAERVELASTLTRLVEIPVNMAGLVSAFSSGGMIAHCWCEAASSGDVEKKWEQAAASAFDAEMMVNTHIAMLAKAHSSPALIEAIEFSKSPLGRKVAAAVSASAMKGNSEDAVEAETLMIQNADAVFKADPERKNLLTGIIETTNGIEHSVDMIQAFTRGLSYALRAQQTENTPKPSTHDIENAIETMRPQLKAILGKILLPAYHEQYANLNNEDLDALRLFLTTQTGREVQLTMDRATQAALREQGARVGKQFAKLMQESEL